MRFYISTILLASLLVLSTVSALAQGNGEQSWGDPTLKEMIKPKTQAIYDQGGTWTFRLTNQNPLAIKSSFATELSGTNSEGVFTRIIATSWSSEHRYSAEFYTAGGKLIFVYEALEYLEESAPPDAWRNFKGLAGWERRSFFDDDTIGYCETKGNVDLPRDAASQIQVYESVLGILAGK